MAYIIYIQCIHTSMHVYVYMKNIAVNVFIKFMSTFDIY